jgi:hypothetical protein
MLHASHTRKKKLTLLSLRKKLSYPHPPQYCTLKVAFVGSYLAVVAKERIPVIPHLTKVDVFKARLMGVNNIFDAAINNERSNNKKECHCESHSRPHTAANSKNNAKYIPIGVLPLQIGHRTC